MKIRDFIRDKGCIRSSQVDGLENHGKYFSPSLVTESKLMIFKINISSDHDRKFDPTPKLTIEVFDNDRQIEIICTIDDTDENWEILKKISQICRKNNFFEGITLKEFYESDL